MLLGRQRTWYQYDRDVQEIESVVSGVSQSVIRGERIADESGFELIEQEL
jgi:hypothetical protein